MEIRTLLKAVVASFAAVLLLAGTASSGFKTMMVSITDEIETDFARYRPFTVDVRPAVPSSKVPSDLNEVAGYDAVAARLDDAARAYLRENGFVVVPTNDPTLCTMQALYEALAAQKRNIFVTTDAMLTAYHVLFDYSLRVAEVRSFYPALRRLTLGMVEKMRRTYQDCGDEYVSELVLKNLAFFCVPAKILDPEFSVPTEVAELVAAELALMEAHKGKECSPIMEYKEDYSQYVPRGHYTRSETFKRYFKAMMWYGRIVFRLQPNSYMSCVEKPEFEETFQALLAVWALANLQFEGTSGLDLYNRIYTPTVFYVGRADDLTFEDYLTLAKRIWGDGFLSIRPEALYDEAKLALFTEAAKKLRDPLINSSFVLDDEEFEVVTKGFRFMGQRFIPDSYVFQQLVYKNVQNRFLPKGLDVMAALGSSRAYSILDFVYQDTRCAGYQERMERLRVWFTTLPEASWVQNLYWNWLYCLMPLLVTKGEGFPSFMTNLAWTDKELSTALGSWTELRHDTILYAKQSYTYETGIPDDTWGRGYVEPNPVLFSRLASLCDMTISGLSRFDLLLPDYRDRFELLGEMLVRLKRISEKELEGLGLDKEDYEAIFLFGSTLSQILTFPADDAASQNEEDSKMAVVADVHTDPNSNRVLEEATGYPAYIYVVAPVEGVPTLCVGGVYSYYEFAWPMSDRLTDGAWQQMLATGTNPPQPEWMSTFVCKGTATMKQPSCPVLSIATNDLFVSDNDSLSVYLSLASAAGLGDCCAYLAVIEPEGRVLFCPDFSEIPHAFWLNVPAGQSFRDFPIFETAIVPSIPRGKYSWVVAAFDERSQLLTSCCSISPLLVK